MRVLYFTRDYTPHDHRFLSALADTQHEVYSLRLERRDNRLESRPLPEGVQQIDWVGGKEPFRWPNFFRLRKDLKRVVTQLRPDVIHAGPIQLCAFLTASLNIHPPLVSMSWGSDLLKDADRNLFWQWITRFALNRTDILVGDCQAVLQKASQFGYPAERVVLFPWGVDLNHFAPGGEQVTKENLGWQQNVFVVLSLRSWEPIYGVDVLVKGFALAAQKVPDLRLLLLGGGSQEGMIKDILRQNGMLARVYFGGQVSNDDLPRYYRMADLYVSASHSDGSSVSLMEALACGCPVLISDIPGNLEWVNSGQEGWFFKDNDPHDLAEGLLRAYENRGHSDDMGTAARTLAEKRANWPENFKKLLVAYERAGEIRK